MAKPLRITLWAVLMLLGSSAPAQTQRGLDPGFPWAAGCLDYYGYVRPEDVGEVSPEVGKALKKLRSGDSRSAEADVRRVIQTHPDLSAYKTLVDCARKEKKLSALAEELRTKRLAKKTVDLDLAWLYANAILAEDRKGMTSRADEFVAVIRKHKNEKNVGRLVCLASCEHSFGHFRSGQALLEQALTLKPSAFTVRMALAMSYLAGSSKEPSDNEKAWRHASIIVDSDERYPPAYALAGGLAESRKDLSRARALYQKGLSMCDPTSHLAKQLLQALKRLR